MKKTINYILLSAICLLGFSSCNNEDEAKFDESSAQRLNEAVANYNKLLCSSEAGWAMEYFPTEDEQGYTFLMKFDKNTAVNIASKNEWTMNKMEQESSFFQMIADNGPVLSFNTYNSLFHYFSTPEDLPETGEDNEDGRGHLGDYEFIVMNATDNEVTLRGKKRGVDIYLHRLPVGQDWGEYYAKLDNLEKSMFSSKIPSLILQAGGEKYTITNSAKHVMHFVPEGGDAISQTTKMPFIVTEKGIRFVKPFTGDNDKFSIQTLNLTEEGVLVSENSEEKIVAPALLDLFTNTSIAWRIDDTQLSTKFATAYENVVTESKKVFKTVFQYFEFKYGVKAKKPTLSFKNGKYNGMIYIDINTADSNKVSFSFNGEGDNNGLVHLDKTTSYKEFLTLLTSTSYIVTSTSTICPSALKFTSTTDSKDYFIVNIQ
ncbi:MAG: DUF4302 domain-containing protein [Muribaculaceae bacterium]